MASLHAEGRLGVRRLSCYGAGPLPDLWRGAVVGVGQGQAPRGSDYAGLRSDSAESTAAGGTAARASATLGTKGAFVKEDAQIADGR